MGDSVLDNFYWLDGTSTDYLNWNSGEYVLCFQHQNKLITFYAIEHRPNSFDEPCGEQYVSGLWNDV